MKRYYVRQKGKYKVVPQYDFPSKPMDGYWIVQGNSRGWVCRTHDLPRYNAKTLRVLTQRRDGIALILLSVGSLSAHNVACLIVAYLSAKKEWTLDDLKAAIETTKRNGYYEAQ